MAVALQKDPMILALPTMTSVLEFQVKRLENERTTAEKVFNETLQQQQATVNAQQACIAQLKAENLTLRHQSETKTKNLRVETETLRTALKEILSIFPPTVDRRKRFDELTEQERARLNSSYNHYKEGNPCSSRVISSVEVFYSTGNDLPMDAPDEPNWPIPYFYIKTPNLLYVKYGPLVEKK